MELSAVQRAFQARILASESGVESLLVGRAEQIAARVAIYADGYSARLVEALGTTYEALKAVLGEKAFEQEIRAYIAGAHSVHYSVRYYGAGVADHFAARGSAAADQMLAELARFEWLLAEVFDAADDIPASEQALTNLPPETWSTVRFVPRRSLRHFRSCTNAIEWWRAVKNDAPRPEGPALAAAQAWVLWRRGVTTMFRSLDAAEAAALAVAAAGGDFARLCERVAETSDPDAAALQSATIVRRWFSDELLSGVVSG